MLLLLLNGCGDPSQDRFQGYVEGEFVYVASPLAGQLETLSVQRGQQVTAGQPLFALDETAEKAAREQAQAALVLSEAEYTPPVIYSRESRAKLVFMVEAVFDPATSAKLHPGQPVDVHFESKS